MGWFNWTRPSKNEKMAEAVLLLALLNRRRKRRQRRIRTMWVHPIFIQRSQQGEFHHLLQEMRLADTESHFRYLRISKETFDSLLAKVKHFSGNAMLYLLILCYKVEPWLARSRHCSSHSVRTEITPAERFSNYSLMISGNRKFTGKKLCIC